MEPQIQTLVVRPDTGPALRFWRGVTITLKLRSDAMAGAMTACEIELEPGAGLPTFSFVEIKTMLFLAQGELEVELGRKRQRMATNSILLLPPGNHCSLRNRSQQTARIFCVLVPGGSFYRLFDLAETVRSQAEFEAEARPLLPILGLEIADQGKMPHVRQGGRHPRGLPNPHPPPPRILSPEEGTKMSPMDLDNVSTRVSGEDVNGSFACFQTDTPPQAGPPFHIHPVQFEIFYVIDGSFEIAQLGGWAEVAGAGLKDAAHGSHFILDKGAVAVGHPGVHHTYRNILGTNSQFFIMMVPGAGLTRFFYVANELGEQGMTLPEFSQWVQKYSADYAIEFVVTPEGQLMFPKPLPESPWPTNETPR